MTHPHPGARDNAPPGTEHLFAVTFSVRAAGELRLRLADRLGETVARGVTAATFYSVCARLLREHAGVFGRTERYTIYDQADMRRVINWLLSDTERGDIQRALADYGQPAGAEVLDRAAALQRVRLRRLLAGPDGNLCVCGDDDQLIHGWRHPDPRLAAPRPTAGGTPTHGTCSASPIATRAGCRSCSGGTSARAPRSFTPPRAAWRITSSGHRGR